MARKRSLRKTRRRVRKGGMKSDMPEAESGPVPDQEIKEEPQDMVGGKKRKMRSLLYTKVKHTRKK